MIHGNNFAKLYNFVKSLSLSLLDHQWDGQKDSNEILSKVYTKLIHGDNFAKLLSSFSPDQQWDGLKDLDVIFFVEGPNLD